MTKNYQSRFFLIALSTLIMQILLAQNVGADAVMNVKPDGFIYQTKSANYKAYLEGKGRKYRVFKDTKFLYETVEVPELSHGDAYISANGRTLIWTVASHFFGHLEDAASLRKNALLFFRDGELIKTYSLQEILARPNLVMETSSHTVWLAENCSKCIHPNPRFFHKDKHFRLQTTSFRDYVFDAQTGGIVSERDMQVWSAADLIVWGEPKPSTSNSSQKELGFYAVAKGDPKSAEGLRFTDRKGLLRNGTYIMAFKKQKDGKFKLLDQYRNYWHFNKLTPAGTNAL